MTNSLSLESQKLLTELLGECWHVKWVDPTGFCSTQCASCGKILDEIEDAPRLDFSDWRVVGRLINKLRSHILDTHGDVTELPLYLEVRLHYIETALWSNNPQLAICLAVVEYLKGEK
jgi:hypothetical protein